MAAIGAGDLGAGIDRRDRPSAVVGGAEEIGETGGRIEARPAKPIDGKVAPDEGGCLAIPDDRVVFDVQGHAPASGVKIRAKTYLNTRILILTSAPNERVSKGAPRGSRGALVLRVQAPRMKAFAHARSCSSANVKFAVRRVMAKAADACGDAKVLDCRYSRGFAKRYRESDADAMVIGPSPPICALGPSFSGKGLG